MRRSGPDATGSGSSTRTSYGVVVRGRATHGTSMRCSSRSTAHSGTCGARSTSTATRSTFWSSRAETRWPQRSSSAACARACGRCPGYRQARQLPGGAPRAHGVGAASPVEAPEQPRRELSPADPATPAGDEPLHVDPARATIPVRVQRHLAALSAPSAPAVGRRLPTGDGASRSGTRSPGRRPRPPPESATGTRRFDQAHGSTTRIITSANWVGSS